MTSGPALSLWQVQAINNVIIKNTTGLHVPSQLILHIKHLKHVKKGKNGRHGAHLEGMLWLLIWIQLL